MLRGKRIGLVGRFTSMSRRQAEQLVRSFGGVSVLPIDAQTEWVVVGDEVPDVRQLINDSAWCSESGRIAWEQGNLLVAHESEFWAQLGLVDSGDGVERLYTPAMLAGLVRVPVRAIRHWQRKGHLSAAREVGRLPYFDFEQVRIALRLAQLFDTGCSLSRIDRRLDELARLRPGMPRPLADPTIIIEGSRLYVRRGDGLAEPSGQLLMDFDGPRDEPVEGRETRRDVATIPIATAAHHLATSVGHPTESTGSASSDELRSLADEFEESGETRRAIEVYRAILMSGEFTAEDQFYLAELLYQCGDLGAARERYYAAIEMDEDYVEARANLGCVLAELGERSLAEAAFRGALEYHPDFADAHYHLARLLDSMEQLNEAAWHWQQFLKLAPASPWAEEAIDRTGGSVMQHK
jgi:DNA-binding transcriptional MerR regulator